jgi:hypothetical protein
MFITVRLNSWLRAPLEDKRVNQDPNAAIKTGRNLSPRRKKDKEKGKKEISFVSCSIEASKSLPKTKITLCQESVRECREMRGVLLTKSEFSSRAKKCIGGRNCHRKHVEDG